jgi:hypothetical protein
VRIGGACAAETCSAAEAMKAMRKELPNWRDSR